MPHLSQNDLERLATELSSYARSGVPMPAGLRELSGSLKSGRLKNLTEILARDAQAGRPLSESLRAAPVQTPAEFSALVESGETTGDMGSLLSFAVEHGRRVKRYRSALATSLTYPLLVLTLFVLITSMLLLFVIPRFIEVYDQLGAMLPGPTMLLVDASYFVHTMPGQVTLGIIAVLVLVLFLAVLSESVSSRMLGMLGMRHLTSLSDSAVSMKMIGALTSRGVPLATACRTASLAVTLPESRDSLRTMSAAAESGHPVAPLISRNAPATAAWLFAQGEARGNVAETCEAISHYCEERFELMSRRSLALLEPALLFMLAAIIGFTLLALYLPLFSISCTLSGRD